MRLLAAASAGHVLFELDSPAIESTMNVYVNGEERMSGWHLDSEDNMLIFDESIPEAGDHVRLIYSGPADCDE